ncbi:MAG: right-handed parallel beta-helix repeat-containing protein, partial [Dissulfurispiraceae bacterium]
MKRKKPQRRGISNFHLKNHTEQDEKKRQCSNLIPSSLHSGDWQSMPIVSGLINYFKKLRGEKRRPSPRYSMGLGMRRLTNEPLEARCLLSIGYVDSPGDYNINPITHKAGDWVVTSDINTPNVLDAGDTVTWQAGISGKETPGLVWGSTAFGTIQSAIAVTALDTVNVAPGSYSEALTINRSLTLQGDGATGASQTVLNGDSSNVGVNISGSGVSVAMGGFAIQNWDSGVWIDSATFSLSNSIVQNSLNNGVTVDLGGAATITGSDITGNHYGVIAGSGSQTGNVIISGSDLTGNDLTGLRVLADGTAQIYGSNLSGYTGVGQKAVTNTNTSATVNASGDYWGSTNELTINNYTSGKVDFTPYLAAGAAMQPATGFAGDLSTVYVTTQGEQSGSTGRIQEGVDLIYNGSLTGGNRRVDVLAGTYTEQVTITKSLELIGAGEDSTKILAPSSRTGTVTQGTTVHDYIVAAYAPSSTIDVRIEGFTIDANGQNKTPGTAQLDGVFFRNVKDAGGTMAGLYASTIMGFASTPDYESWGVVVYGDSALTLDDNAVSGFTRDGIDVFGDAGAGADPTVTISRNVVTGSAIGLNGMAIEDGAMATITGNTVTGMTRSTPWAGGAIGVWDSDGVIIGGSNPGDANQIDDNFYGIDLINTNHATVSGNTLTHNVKRSISLDNS